MGFIIGLLTFVMVVDCLVLVLLVLVQLPKKEAGAGLAFGGAATEALFGAGPGNVLTKITKYAATIFFILALLLSVLQKQRFNKTSNLLNRVANPSAAQPALPSTAPATTPNAPATPAAPLLNLEETNRPATNAVAAPSAAAPAAAPTNAPAATNAAPQK